MPRLRTINDHIKFGSAIILILVTMLAIFTITSDINKTPQVLIYLIYVMVLISIITAIGNFLKKR